MTNLLLPILLTGLFALAAALNYLGFRFIERRFEERLRLLRRRLGRTNGELHRFATRLAALENRPTLASAAKLPGGASLYEKQEARIAAEIREPAGIRGVGMRG